MTIGILASTTTGIEPLFSVAYKRRYLVDGNRWKYQYVIDGTAKRLIETYELDPDSIQSSYSLVSRPEERVRFQADVQDYVDMGISSTINLPQWGSELNNEDTYKDLGNIILKYAPRLRGITCFPDGSRGFQPLTEVSYAEAVQHEGIIYEEEERCSGGVCGI